MFAAAKTVKAFGIIWITLDFTHLKIIFTKFELNPIIGLGGDRKIKQ